MDQVNQTNNLQQAINEVANKDQFGVPPMPPTEGEGVPSAPFADEPAEEKGPSAEQILSDTLAEAPAAPATEMAAPKVETPAAAEPVVTETEVDVSGDLATTRENILRDLLPIMDAVEGTPEEKFDIYKDAMATLNDKSIISDAYKVATKIADENKKADALLGLMKAIDEK